MTVEGKAGAVGLDGVYRMLPGENALPAGIRGHWIDETTFLAEYDGVAAIDAFDMKFHFQDDRVTLDAKDRTYAAGVTIEGVAGAGD